MDLFIDIEFHTQPQIEVFLIGLQAGNGPVEQLYGRNLTPSAVMSRLRKFAAESRFAEPIIFCHGSDIGILENHFLEGRQIRQDHACVNFITIARKYSPHREFSLAHLAKQYGASWEDPDVQGRSGELWSSGSRSARERVKSYNSDDVRNLNHVVTQMRRNYGIRRSRIIDLRLQ